MLASVAGAEGARIALFHTELAQSGPGLLYRDILKGTPQVDSAIDRLTRAQADVVLLLDVDHDAQGLAARALAARLDFPHVFAFAPNSGVLRGFDLDGDGRVDEPEDALGYGEFTGQGGMVVLSRWPVLTDKAQDFSGLIWRDLPWATLPKGVFPPKVAAMLPLVSTGHWVVPVALPNGQTLSLLAFHATPPAFDGPEDRNGMRNADQLRFWGRYLADTPPAVPFVLIGDANLDPDKGDGRREAIQSLLANPALQDPFATLPDRDSVDWSDIDLGRMRVDYILPDARLTVTDRGMVWPDPGDTDASRHALLWVDIALPPVEPRPVLEFPAANE
jgi:hypothetical protein